MIRGSFALDLSNEMLLTNTKDDQIVCRLKVIWVHMHSLYKADDGLEHQMANFLHLATIRLKIHLPNS